jgi:plastocyanin
MHRPTIRQVLLVGVGLQRPGENVEVTFTARGQHQISCGIHPRMSMTVEVE